MPPFSEQRAIAAFLDRETAKIDALVDEQKRLIELLKEKRQAVISHAVTKGLDPNAPMKDSGVGWLGQVPEHWSVTPLGRTLLNIEQGWSPTADDRPPDENEACVLRLSAVKDGRFDVTECKALPTIADELKADRATLRNGDLLLTRANTPNLVGDCAIAGEIDGRIIFSDLMYRLTPDLHAISVDYLLAVLRAEPSRLQVRRDARGSSMSMAKISHGHIKSWLIALPPAQEQRAIIASLREGEAAIGKLIADCSGAIKLLMERRSALVSAAVTGKIDVRGVAAEIAEAAA